MAKNKIVQEAMDWNLKRCISPEKLMKKVRKILKNRAKHSEIWESYGYVTVRIEARLSEEGFKIVKDTCAKEGIEFGAYYYKDYRGPFINLYYFKVRVL